MENPIEYFKIISSLNLHEIKKNQNLKISYLNKRINNKTIYSKFFKDRNYNILKEDKIKNGSIKLPQNIKINDKYNEDINISKNLDKMKLNKKELPKNNSNNLNSLSEVKNFKTEICHSWELTGTCKYGLNVS